MTLSLPYNVDGVGFPDAVFRATLGVVDLKVKQVTIIVKVHSSPTQMENYPDRPFDREIIWVTPADILTYFVPFAANPTVPLVTMIDSFLRTINPMAEGSKYPGCRFNFSVSTIL